MGGTWVNKEIPRDHSHTSVEGQGSELTGYPKSNPPSGKYRVTNLYVNEAGKLVVEYENTPAK